METLKRADLMLILMTRRSDLSSSWDWSLYELGHFTSQQPETQKPIVALVAPDADLPMSLTSIHRVPATVESIRRFLEDLLVGGQFSPDHSPINAFAPRGKISSILDELASQIGKVFEPPTGGIARLYANSLVLTVRRDDVRDGRIPEHAMIEASGQTLRLFGLREGPTWNWGDLEKSVRGDKSWTLELGAAVRAILDDRLPSEIHAELLGVDGVGYSVMLVQDERRSSGIRRLHMLFLPRKEEPIDPKLVLVICAFRPETDTAFEAIHAAAKHHGLEARRVKDEVGDYRITERLIQMIRRAKLLVADLTYERPNVYFELGYARGIRKTVVTTVRKGTQIHFDVKDWTYLEYDDTRNLERALILRIGSELEKDSQNKP